ncbi:MAG: hypothetical protein RL885_07215 [Planctomycetota bacterium]
MESPTRPPSPNATDSKHRLFLVAWSTMLLLGALVVHRISRTRPEEVVPTPIEIATAAADRIQAPTLEPELTAETLGELTFVENRGQWRGDFRFAAHGADFTATFDPRGIALAIRRVVEDEPLVVPVRLEFDRADPNAEILGLSPRPGVHNYLLGPDPAGWQLGVELFSELRYVGLYEGIDLRVREGSGSLEYDLLAAPGADWRAVEVSCQGVTALDATRGGGLRLHTPWGAIEQKPPTAWYELPDGSRRRVRCTYRVLDERRFGFQIVGEEPWPLVIDPALEWSTLLGGSDLDWLSRIEITSAEEPVVAGTTASVDFPTTSGAFDQSLSAPSWDVFVSKLDTTGSHLLFSTFVGGTGFDYARALAVDTGDAIVVGGWTDSSDFPTTPGTLDGTGHSSRDGFVFRLSSDGTQLLASTYISGQDDDAVHALAIDASGNVNLAGETRSPDLPMTPNAFDGSYNGGSTDIFLLELDAALGQLVYGTYLGGSDLEETDTLKIDGDGGAVIAGRTWSYDFPVSGGCYDDTISGRADAFVARFSPGLDQLVYSTLIGGSKLEWADDLAVDAAGRVTIGGFTESVDYPTTPLAFDRTHDGGGVLGTDAFITQFSPDGSMVLYSTFVGGTGDDFIYSISLDERNRPVVAGMTRSADFPVTHGALETEAPSLGAGSDGFALRLSSDGRRCEYATYLGGQDDDFPLGLHLGLDGAAIVGGYTRSTDFPVTAGAFSNQHSGSFDVFVSRLRLGPTIRFNGLPLPNHVASFVLEGAPSSLTGHSVQILISCSAPGETALPGGFVLPIQVDGCTLLGIRLAVLLQCTVGANGTAQTTSVFFPSAPSGLTVRYAAVVWDPTVPVFTAVTPAGSLTVQ